MDKIKKENLRESIEHTSLFFSILKDYYNKLENNTLTEEESEKMIDFMKSNHFSNKRNLENIGCSFDDTGKIRELNLNIHELEKKLGDNENITPENISSFIQNLKNNFNELFKEKYGLDFSFDISFSTIMSVKIKHIYACLPLQKSRFNHHRNEEEYNLSKIKHDENHQTLNKSNLEYSEEGDIYFTESNVKYIEQLIRMHFKDFGSINDIENNVSFYKSKANKGAKELYIFRNIEFSLSTLPSYISIKSIFKK